MFLIGVSAILGAIILRWLFSYVWSYLRDPYKLNQYPGPWLAKHSRIWLGYIARRGQRSKVIHQLHLKYGRIVRIAPNELSIADPDAISIVLGHGTGTTKSKFYDAFVAIHLGLFSTRDRKEHARKRKIIANTFSPTNVMDFEPYLAKLVKDFIDKWDERLQSPSCDDSDSSSLHTSKNWATLNCLIWFNYLSFDIIGDLAFGAPFGMIEKGLDVATVEDEDGTILNLPAVKIVNERGEYTMAQGCLPPSLRPWMVFIDPWFSRGAMSVKYLSGIARNRVNQRLAGADEGRKDLLSRLQQGKDAQGNPMGRAELTAEALTQLIAGSDTTSNSTCAIFWWIIKHPRVQKRLSEELKTQLGDTDGVVNYSDCSSLTYMKACIQEALRIHSTSSLGLPRVIEKDHVEFKGHILRKGLVCSIPTYTLHHDEEIWGDPFVFRPERWLSSEVQRAEKAFIPFSYGPRACVGRNLAHLQLEVVVATLFHRYEFKLLDPNQAELEVVEGFLRKPVQCWIQYSRRND